MGLFGGSSKSDSDVKVKVKVKPKVRVTTNLPTAPIADAIAFAAGVNAKAIRQGADQTRLLLLGGVAVLAILGARS